MPEEQDFFLSRMSSGGLGEPYDLTIYMAAFGYDGQYMNGERLCLILDGVNEADEPMRELISVGDGWETLDGGRTMSFPDKPNKTFNKNSKYGKWCTFAYTAAVEAKSDVLSGKDPMDSGIWINTRWRLTEQQVLKGFKNRQTGEVVEDRTGLMPTTFLGLAEDAPAPPAQVPQVAPEAAALAARRAALADAANASTAAPEESPIVSRLRELAKAPTFDEFVNAALAEDEVVADEELATSVIDKSSDGFYSKHHQ